MPVAVGRASCLNFTGSRSIPPCLLDLLAAGPDRAEILADYPYLEAGNIVAVLEFAAKQSDHPVLRSG